MKKRLIAVMLVLCICMTIVPLKAEAATSGKCGNNVNFNFTESTGLLKITGTGDMWDFNYNYGYSDAPWWEYVANVKKVEIGSGVTRIGNTAFNGCWDMESITIPSTVASIGSRAFYGCTALTSITLPSKITAIQSYTFYRTGITEIDLPDGVTSIGTGAFADSSLTSIDIPAGVTTISADLFYDCNNLEKVTIRGNITNIGDAAFYNTALKELTFEGTLSGYIGEEAFAYSENLPSFHVPGTVTSIKAYAFCGCKALTDLTLEEGLKSIDDSAFRETGISTLSIPSTVNYFGSNIAVFADNLKNVTLYSQSLKNCKSNVVSNGDLDYVHIIGDAPDTTVKVFAREDLNPGFIVYYDEGTSGWEEPTWNGYIIEMWGKPWSTKTGTCGENVTWTLDADGVLTISGTGPMKDVSFYSSPWYIFRDRIQKAVVKEGVTTLGTNAFYDLYNLKSAEIAGSVETIKDGAFSKCDLLDTLILHEGLQTIEGRAFVECSALTSVDLPDSVTKLGSGAFFSCYNLYTVYMPAGLTAYSASAFSSSFVKEIYFPGDAPTFGSDCFRNLTTTVYYPYGNDTWTDDVMQNYGGTITWIPYAPEERNYVRWYSGTTSLNGTIDLNIYVLLSKDLVEAYDTYVRFIYDGNVVDVPMADAIYSPTDDYSNRYRFSCPIYAKQLADNVTVKFMKGNAQIGKDLNYSVVKYCVNQIAKVTDPQELALYKAMLNYGAAAQLMFEHNVENLANASLSDADKVLPDVDASAYKYSISGKEEGIRAKSATLMLEDVVKVRVYFALTGTKTIDQYTFTIDGKVVTPKQNDKGYYVETSGIAAKDLEKLFEIQVGGITVKYGALSYVNSKANGSNKLEANISKALFVYWQAADSYLG